MTLELNRIYCMDCLEGMRQMPDKSVDLVLTDPPYGVNYGDGEKSGILGKPLHGVDCKEYQFFNDKPITKKYISEILRISKNQIIFGGQYYTHWLPQSSGWIIWEKNTTGCMGEGVELAWTSFKRGLKLYEFTWNGMLQENMNRKEERFHPTQKPALLFEDILKDLINKHGIICDPFFGSGSSIIAAIKLGHSFIGFEKERVYFEAAERRIKKAQEQGKLAEWF